MKKVRGCWFGSLMLQMTRGEEEEQDEMKIKNKGGGKNVIWRKSRDEQ